MGTPRLESDSSVAVSSSLTQDTSQSASPSDKFSDKYSSDKKGADAQAEVVPEMKTNDLNPSLNFPGENDLSNLPFSMPKLERRLKESRQSLVISSLTNHLVSAPPPSKKPSLNLNIPARQTRVTRPISLHSTCHVSTPNVSNPAISQLKLPLQGFERNPSPAQSVGNLNFKSFKRKPLLFLTPSINLGQSVSVDTNLPLENQEWYHGVMTRSEAEQVLKTHSEGSYLLRATLDHGKPEYSLAIKSSRGFMHLRILRVDDDENISFKLGDFDKKFSSIVDMVHHYTINRLPIKGAEHMCLLTPVTEELL